MRARTALPNRGNDTLRLIKMVVVLGLVTLLTIKAANPDNWRWLVPEADEQTADHDPAKGVPKSLAVPSRPIQETSTRPLPAATPSATAKSINELAAENSQSQLAYVVSSLKTALSKATTPQTNAAELNPHELNAPELTPVDPKLADAPLATGPTDLDEEEFESAIERFQSVFDGSLGIEGEEMPAYSQILNWVRHQPLKLLAARAVPDISFHDLTTRPKYHRGQIVKVELNVRRVLPYKVESKPGGFETFYEVWGFNKNSGSWLYVGVTPYLPEGMPTGASVFERVTFYGYFYKLQGYYEAKANPRDKPLMAPLLIGRMQWHRSEKPTLSDANEYGDTTTWIVGGLGLLFIVYIGLRTLLTGRSKAQGVSREATESVIGGFLDNKPVDNHQAEDDVPDDGSSTGQKERDLWQNIVNETPRKG